MARRGGAAGCTLLGCCCDDSNTNFILLGDMVGQLTGHDIGAYAAEHIFEPLQMTDTYWWESQDGPSPYWRMPSSDPGDVSPFSCAALDQTVGTEGLTFVTSLDDMDRFLRGLFDGDVISPATFDEMLPRDGEPGLGLWSETSDETGVTLVGHFGSRRDFSAVAYFEPNDQRSVIVFADTGVDVEELMWEAADWAEANDL